MSIGTTEKNKGFKIGVCDWNLGKTADPGCFAVAKEIGLDGVQISLGTVKDNMSLRQKAVQEKFLAESKKHGVEITSLAIGTLNSIPYKSDPRAEQWVADSIDVCKALNIKVVLLALLAFIADVFHRRRAGVQRRVA